MSKLGYQFPTQFNFDILLCVVLCCVVLCCVVLCCVVLCCVVLCCVVCVSTAAVFANCFAFLFYLRTFLAFHVIYDTW